MSCSVKCVEQFLLSLSPTIVECSFHLVFSASVVQMAINYIYSAYMSVEATYCNNCRTFDYVLELQTQVYFTSMYGIHLPLQCLSSNHLSPSCQAKRVLGLQGVLNANKFGNLAGCFHLHFFSYWFSTTMNNQACFFDLIYSTRVQEKPHTVLALVSRMVVMVN